MDFSPHDWLVAAPVVGDFYRAHIINKAARNPLYGCEYSQNPQYRSPERVASDLDSIDRHFDRLDEEARNSSLSKMILFMASIPFAAAGGVISGTYSHFGGDYGIAARFILPLSVGVVFLSAINSGIAVPNRFGGKYHLARRLAKMEYSAKNSVE